MFSRKRFLAGASAVALAAGTTLAGAGVASAQDEEESAGSLASSSIDFGETAADLALAATALNGPVAVSGNAEGGPTVTYTNESEDAESCVGFTIPYTTVDELGIDPAALDLSDLFGAIAVIQGIENAGGVALLMGDEAGEPTSMNDPDPAAPNEVVGIVLPLLGAPNEDGVVPGTVAVEAGEAIEWSAAGPEEPSAGVVLCIPDASEDRLGDLGVNFGIDPQVVADQINGKIPGGSVEPVSAGSISGGSVSAGATMLGSLAGGDDADTEEPPVEEPAE